ncbi:hypothetical protein ACHQM5_013904 [Ranunculus cassubicifolius]
MGPEGVPGARFGVCVSWEGPDTSGGALGNPEGGGPGRENDEAPEYDVGGGSEVGAKGLATGADVIYGGGAKGAGLETDEPGAIGVGAEGREICKFCMSSEREFGGL